MLSILPFKNKLIKLEVTGAVLRAALENGVSRSAEDSQPGGFPQVSGIRFSFDASRKAGSRVVDVTVKGQPLIDSKKYSLTTTTFLAVDGGDGYSVFKGAPVITPPEKLPLDSDVFQRMIRVQKLVRPRVEGRITRLDKAAKPQTDCE